MNTHEMVVVVACKREGLSVNVQANRHTAESALRDLRNLMTDMKQPHQDFWRGFSPSGVLKYVAQVYGQGRVPGLGFARLSQEWHM